MSDEKPGMALPLVTDHEFVQRERTSFVALIPNEAKGRSCAKCGQSASDHQRPQPEPLPLGLS